MSHRARKRFGQHFLTSAEFIDRIVAAIAPRAGETIVEIGPGKAAITRPLATTSTTLHAIEFDRDLANSLSTRFAADDNVTIHEGDALKFDFSQLGDQLRIVGNLPYNISTPLIFHLLNHRRHIVDMHFMLQKEVVDRMAAMPGNKKFGRLTVMLGCHMEVVALFDVPPTAFSPPPKVMSSVVRLRPLTKPKADNPEIDICDAALLEKIVKTAFSRRRKTMRNALQGLVDAEAIKAVNISVDDRPEQIAIADWIRLANHLHLG